MRSALALLLLAILSPLAAAADRSPLGQSLMDIEIADHWIYDDLPKAVAEAKATNRPLLVVLRCIPCPPGRTLDEQVMRPDSALLALEKQFVCVRLIQTNSLDLAVFQYDYDMSWAAMFLNADLTIYGRYGSRNAAGKDSSDGLLSVAAFRKAAERALALHAGYPGNKQQLAAKTGPPPQYATPTQIPGLENRPASASVRQECIHCHMVKEFALRKKWEEGRLRAADLFVYPLPSSIGLTTDLDDGLRITSVAAGSPAAAAGLAAGDELVSIGGQPLISLADIQWALHTAPSDADLAVRVNRGGRALETRVVVRGDWKRSDIAWRASSWYSLRQGVKFEPLPAAEKASRGIAEDRLALVIKGLYGQGGPKVQKAGLKQNDVVLAVDGKSEAMTESDFLVWLRLAKGPNDAVKFTILRGTEKHDLTIPLW